ncbi:MAG: sigma-70 family RNA polymerase sigma factor [Pirellulales bacterium]|nr:sigma-70 family RNA polymerase sigma factor [Pirellulales bacterium]
MSTFTHHEAQRLLAEAREGTPECLGRLLAYYTNYLKLLVSTQIDQKLRARCSPSDVVQETFCDVHRDFEQFRGQSEPEFLAWLRAILANNMAREVEKHILTAKRDVRREVSFDAMGKAIERSAARLGSILMDQGPSPSSNVQRHDRAVQLADHLAELPPDYRDVLVLRHCEGLPFKEVAERMGRSTGAVRMLWLRAIGRVREQMEAEGGA